MNEVLFIGAGTRGARKIRNSFQPYLRIRRKTCIEYVFDAVYDSQLVKKIYIWGNRKRLARLLERRIELLSKAGVDVKIINERSY